MMDNNILRSQADLYADIAEMYFLDGKTQAEIAEIVGIHRSMISRMLAEARRMGIVEVNIHRPLHFDRDLQNHLVSVFGLKNAFVLDISDDDLDQLKAGLAKAGAYVLKKYLYPDAVLGIAWGSTVSETVKAFQTDVQIPVKVVQLVGAIGARSTHFDGHWLVQCLSEKLRGEGYYLNTPFMVASPEVAQALIDNPSLSETIRLWKQVDIGLFGIGTIDPIYSSFYNAGFITGEELNQLQAEGAIGDVCGLQLNFKGEPTCHAFESRLIAIPRADLLRIPIRLGVAGGHGKILSILAALRGKYINVLVTDSRTARKLIEVQEVEP